MDLFPFVESGTPVLVSASESGLFLHPVHNERFGRPVLLCSGYKSGFSGCVYNNSLHYAYINKENSLLLRRLHESVILFRLDSPDNITYREPRLTTFDSTLFLFYLEQTPESYHLKLRLPFTDDTLQLPEPFQAAYPEPPTLFLQTTEHSLYLFLTVEKTGFSYRYSKKTGFELLCSEEEFLSGLRLPWEDEKAQLEQALLRAVHLSEQQQNILTEKEQKLQATETRLSELVSETEQKDAQLDKITEALQHTQAQLETCEQRRLQVTQNLEHTSLLLERAKAQYNELMSVAEQYRREAMKWYGKFTDRN